MLLRGDIEASDYRIMKAEAENKINRLEAILWSANTETQKIENLLEKAISNLSELDTLYTNGSVYQKRRIIGSMLPEKLTFQNSQVRTARETKPFALFHSLTAN